MDDFRTLDVRVGTVVAAEVLRGARKPAFCLQVDFGPLGRRTSTAQITDLYDPAELVGLQVLAVVNLPPRRVAGADVVYPPQLLEDLYLPDAARIASALRAVMEE